MSDDPPLPVDPAQKYPYPFRARGARENTMEVRYELRGKTTICYRWTYVGGTERTDFETGPLVHKSAAAAAKVLETWAKGTREMGWDEVTNWPSWGKQRAAAPPPVAPKPYVAKPDPPFAWKPVPLATVRVTGKGKPAAPDAIAKAFRTEVPKSYADLLGKLGAGTFAGRLRVLAPAGVVTTTKAWRKRWTHDGGRIMFVDYDRKLGERAAALVIVATSIEGDNVGFVAGDPSKLYVLPRNRNTIDVMKTFADVLGRYLAVAKRTDGAGTKPTYVTAAR